jgi:hypothetical protein
MNRPGPLRIAIKLICGGAGLCVVLFLAYLYAEPYFSAMCLARGLSDVSPLLGSVPQQLLNKAVSSTPGKFVSQFGYQFEIPCPDIDRTILRGHMVSFHCTNERTLTFYDPNFSKPELFHHVSYDSIASSLNAVPGQLSLLHSRSSNQRLLGLLLDKSKYIMKADGHIYSIDRTNLRGFQLGDPSAFLSNFELFDSQNRHIRFWIASKTSLSQEQINRTIESLKRIPKSSDIESSSNSVEQIK